MCSAINKGVLKLVYPHRQHHSSQIPNWCANARHAATDRKCHLGEKALMAALPHIEKHDPSEDRNPHNSNAQWVIANQVDGDFL